MQNQIVAAIRGKRLIEVIYEGERRVAEPHVLGERGKDNQLQVHVFQLRNESRPSSRPGWRFYLLAKIERLHVRGETFPGRRSSGSYHHAEWNRVIAMVEP